MDIIEYSDYLYVFWVKTGEEEKAAKEILTAFNHKVVHEQLLVEKFFRKQKMVKKETHIAFPGYVFIVSNFENNEFIKRAAECVRNSKSVIQLLSYDSTGESAVHKEERAAIDCLWRGESCIEASIGYFEGDKVVVIEGAFAGKESVIKRIHPRRHQAVVEIEFMGGVRRITVGLKIVQKL